MECIFIRQEVGMDITHNCFVNVSVHEIMKIHNKFEWDR